MVTEAVLAQTSKMALSYFMNKMTATKITG